MRRGDRRFTAGIRVVQELCFYSVDVVLATVPVITKTFKVTVDEYESVVDPEPVKHNIANDVFQVVHIKRNALIHTYIHIYIYIYIYIYIFFFLFVFMYTCAYVQFYAYTQLRMHV